ncbi:MULTISPECIES: pyridoxamine 5'-phosphate oxidase family protein [Thermocrispum]|uniref:Pyridoxamine 5'-phosphate oxidase family protein n=1 Tax=Thermocrispum agreste TaxID=37925 RepID=A0A2W4LYY6_9PSEU|nr:MULTISPECIES: pyridoxamine 5'-phosphate oxidase family protein [Thermocrispum]PZN00817.1 MAG: pyridoxamine 5'-phosphate oxidase family protein [Thermocrispum agreste]
MSAAPLSPTPRSTPNRTKHRTVTDRAALYEVLDAGLVCHLGIVLDSSPVVLPTTYGREGDTLYLHGSTGARSLRAAAKGADVCVAVTHVDGIVYARSLMHHSINYRSAVIHGTATPITERSAKLHALRVITDHLAPGSWGYARDATNKELAAVSVLALPLAEASVKIRATYPGDDPEDVEANAVWAGVLPLEVAFGAPIPSPDMTSQLPVPPHVTERRHLENPRAYAAAVPAG